MKLFVLTFSFLFCSLVLFSQTKGELTVSTSTSDTGGKYKPKNSIVIWIEDNLMGLVTQFIKI